MASNKGWVVPLLGAAVATGVSVACALRFQSRYFEQVDCVTASSAACVDATPAAMAMWGVAAAVSAFIATAFTGYAVLRFWRGLARGGA